LVWCKVCHQQDFADLQKIIDMGRRGSVRRTRSVKPIFTGTGLTSRISGRRWRCCFHRGVGLVRFLPQGHGLPRHLTVLAAGELDVPRAPHRGLSPNCVAFQCGTGIPTRISLE
jgi:hypothetical protein